MQRINQYSMSLNRKIHDFWFKIGWGGKWNFRDWFSEDPKPDCQWTFISIM